jgi:hypothetical protein
LISGKPRPDLPTSPVNTPRRVSAGGSTSLSDVDARVEDTVDLHWHVLQPVADGSDVGKPAGAHYNLLAQ